MTTFFIDIMAWYVGRTTKVIKWFITKFTFYFRCGMAYDRRSVSKEAVEARKKRTGPGSSAPMRKPIDKAF